MSETPSHRRAPPGRPQFSRQEKRQRDRACVSRRAPRRHHPLSACPHHAAPLLTPSVAAQPLERTGRRGLTFVFVFSREWRPWTKALLQEAPGSGDRLACAAAGPSTPLRELHTTPPQTLRRALRRAGAWARLQEAPVVPGAPAACAACARPLRARRRRRPDVPMRATGGGAGQTCPCELRGRAPGEGAGRR